MPAFTEIPLAELWAMPTINQGQYANLKKETPRLRYWINRGGPEDGYEYPVEVEGLVRGRWLDLGGYGSWDEYRQLNEAIADTLGDGETDEEQEETDHATDVDPADLHDGVDELPESVEGAVDAILSERIDPRDFMNRRLRGAGAPLDPMLAPDAPMVEPSPGSKAGRNRLRPIGSPPIGAHPPERTDYTESELRSWVLNDEMLYNWFVEWSGNLSPEDEAAMGDFLATNRDDIIARIQQRRRGGR